MSGTLTILNRVRERVVAGDWRNYLVWLNEDDCLNPYHDQGPGCILQLCCQVGDDEFLARGKLIDQLLAEGLDPSLIQWNDSPDRTPEDVIALIDRAIALGGE